MEGQNKQPLNNPAPREHSQFALLGSRRFAPFFWTQFLGAFNDNVFKNSLMAMVTFGLLSSGLDLNLMNIKKAPLNLVVSMPPET